MLPLSKIVALYEQLLKTFKKLALVFVTSAPITDISKEEVVLARVPYIYYPLYFKKNNQNKVEALINSNNEINTITLPYAFILGL